MTDSSDKVFTFTWKIENFSMLPHQMGKKLMSSYFMVDFWKKIEFCLWLFPRGEKESEGFIGCYLCKMPANELDLKLTLSLTFESTEPATEISRQTENCEMTYGLGYPNFASRDDVFTKKRLYLPQDTLTVRCVLRPSNESSIKFTGNDELKSVMNFMRNSCVSRTSFPIHRRSITWPIQNIHKVLEQQRNKSLRITCPLKNSPSLNLSLNFSSEDYIQIEIKQTSLPPESELFVKCKMTVITAHWKFQVSEESTHLFSLKLDDKWKFPQFIKASNLTRKKCLFLDDTLLLQCDFAFTYNDTEYHVENSYMPFTFNAMKNEKIHEFSTGLENLYANEKFCDIELKTCNKTFPFYKIVLCARSPVFSTMLETNMKEKNSNVVEIPDVDSETLNRFLTFLCSNVINEDLSLADTSKLYKAADKYDVVSLKSWCSVVLASSLSVSSVCDLLVLADAHQDNVLMNVVHNFISHHAKEIFRSTHWEMVMDKNPQLSRKIMQRFL